MSRSPKSSSSLCGTSVWVEATVGWLLLVEGTGSTVAEECSLLSVGGRAGFTGEGAGEVFFLREGGNIGEGAGEGVLLLVWCSTGEGVVAAFFDLVGGLTGEGEVVGVTAFRGEGESLLQLGDGDGMFRLGEGEFVCLLGVGEPLSGSLPEVGGG